MSAAGYEPGSVFRSFTEGVDASQRWRRNRQNEEINDILIRGAKDAEGAHRMEMGELGLETSDWGLKNPWLDRFFSFAKGRGAGRMTRPPKGSVSVADIATDFGEDMGSMTPESIYSGEAPSLPEEEMYADGGRPRSALRGYADGTDREARLAAARERAAARGGVERSTQSIEGADRSGRATGRGAGAKDFVSGANIDRARSVMEPDGSTRGPSRGARAANWGRRALSGTVGKLGAVGALGATAADVANTPTEDYRERFGMELGPGEDATFMGDLGVRALGAASDLGSVLTFGAADRLYRDKQRGTQAPAATGIPAPATPAATPAAAGGPASGGMAAGSSVSAGGRRAISPDVSPQDMMDITKIEVSDVGPESIPDFRTRDWSDFREKALQGLVARGMPLAQAAEEVDNQTMRMQQKGFNHFAMQGASLLRAGNTRGAMAAIKAAYQMFPSGDDVNLGVYNGQVYGITIDEETGKPTGQPIAITPESILTLVDQANKPGSWREYAKDARDFEFTVKRYMEVDRPLAAAQGSALLTNASANMMNAQANAGESAAKAEYYRSGGGGGGGGGGAGFRNAERVFRDRLMMMGMTDEMEADRLASVMSQMKQQYPSAPDNLIIEHVMRRANGGGAQE